MLMVMMIMIMMTVEILIEKITVMMMVDHRNDAKFGNA